MQSYYLLPIPTNLNKQRMPNDIRHPHDKYVLKQSIRYFA